MRIIVAGTRTTTESQFKKAIEGCKWIGFVTAVVSGTARGADLLGEEWAEKNGLEVIRFPADWEKYGRRAGPLRNRLMAENAEGLVAIWDGESPGTKSMIELASKLGLRILIARTDQKTFEEIGPRGWLADLWDGAEERAGMKQYASNMSRKDAEREAGLESRGISPKP